MTSCSGLPICLSGIQIFPQGQRSMPRQMRSRLQPWPHTPPIVPACIPDGECAGSECESISPASIPASGMTRADGGSQDGRNSELDTNTHNWPRLALAQHEGTTYQARCSWGQGITGPDGVQHCELLQGRHCIPSQEWFKAGDHRVSISRSQLHLAGMADLDCRREAVRRRSLRNSSFLMDYRLSSRQKDMLSACLESQSSPDEDSSCTPKSVCAKAA